MKLAVNVLLYIPIFFLCVLPLPPFSYCHLFLFFSLKPIKTDLACNTKPNHILAWTSKHVGFQWCFYFFPSPFLVVLPRAKPWCGLICLNRGLRCLTPDKLQAVTKVCSWFTTHDLSGRDKPWAQVQWHGLAPDSMAVAWQRDAATLFVSCLLIRDLVLCANQI